MQIFRRIIQQATEYLNAEITDMRNHEVIRFMVQDVPFALHHITALQMFGMKKAQHGTNNQPRSSKNHEEMQDILCAKH